MGRVKNNKYPLKPITATVKQLMQSEVFQSTVVGKVILIHDLYHDSKDAGLSWIVIQLDYGDYTITRFDKKYYEDLFIASVEHKDVSEEAVFSILLNKYSRGFSCKYCGKFQDIEKKKVKLPIVF